MTTTTIPTEAETLCESCGYLLNGLPDAGACPECGFAIAASSVENPRRLPAWERGRGGTRAVADFFKTTAAVIFRPTDFFRNLLTRQSHPRAATFAAVHLLIASAIAGWAVAQYLDWTHFFIWTPMGALGGRMAIPAAVAVLAISILVLRVAARLTAWEAAYRGLRLPLPVVRRGLYYHTAHFVPVVATIAATIGVFRLLLNQPSPHWMQIATTFVYILCGEVLVGSAYLFITYWIAMRNMMYANR